MAYSTPNIQDHDICPRNCNSSTIRTNLRSRHPQGTQIDTAHIRTSQPQLVVPKINRNMSIGYTANQPTRQAPRTVPPRPLLHCVKAVQQQPNNRCNEIPYRGTECSTPSIETGFRHTSLQCEAIQLSDQNPPNGPHLSICAAIADIYTSQ